MLGGIFGRGRRERDQPPPQQQVAPEVSEALVRADETMRRGGEELGFATAEFGEASTRAFAGALQAAHGHLQEAFRLNGLLLDDRPESPDQVRQLNGGILAATAEVERLVRTEAGAFATRRAELRDVPQAADQLLAEIEDVRSRVTGAEQSLTALEARYPSVTLLAVSDNPEQAQALLGVAERSLDLARRRHERGQGEQATKAVQVASDSIRRADDLLDAVTSFEVEAVHAESTLAAVLADSRSDTSESRLALQGAPDPEVEAATAALETAIAETEAAGSGAGPADPFGALSRLRAANEALDAIRVERSTRPQRRRMQAQLATAIDDADRQVALARRIVNDHPGDVGPAARTRLSQAERLLRGVGDVNDAESALLQARQAADLAAAAVDLAQSDVHATRQHQREQEEWGEGGWDDGRGGRQRGGYGWGGPPVRGGSGMGGMLGGVLGGMMLGGILDDLGDIDF